MIYTCWAYDHEPSKKGKRVLVDRLWPRGITKERLNINEWYREIAPSDELRKWFSHDPEKWEGFKQRYFSELDKNPATSGLLEYCRNKDVVFVFSAKDKEYNNATALKEYVLKRLGPM